MTSSTFPNTEVPISSEKLKEYKDFLRKYYYEDKFVPALPPTLDESTHFREYIKVCLADIDTMQQRMTSLNCLLIDHCRGLIRNKWYAEQELDEKKISFSIYLPNQLVPNIFTVSLKVHSKKFMEVQCNYEKPIYEDNIASNCEEDQTQLRNYQVKFTYSFYDMIPDSELHRRMLNYWDIFCEVLEDETLFDAFIENYNYKLADSKAF